MKELFENGKLLTVIVVTFLLGCAFLYIIIRERNHQKGYTGKKKTITQADDAVQEMAVFITEVKYHYQLNSLYGKLIQFRLQFTGVISEAEIEKNTKYIIDLKQTKIEQLNNDLKVIKDFSTAS